MKKLKKLKIQLEKNFYCFVRENNEIADMRTS